MARSLPTARHQVSHPLRTSTLVIFILSLFHRYILVQYTGVPGQVFLAIDSQLVIFKTFKVLSLTWMQSPWRMGNPSLESWQSASPTLFRWRKDENIIDVIFPDQDLLPGWQWAPMDITTEMPELPFRRWNTSIPICGDSLFLFFLDVSTPSLILHLSDSLKLGSACKYAFYMLWGCLAFEFINIEWINTYCQNKALGRTSRQPAEVKYANIELCRYFD